MVLLSWIQMLTRHQLKVKGVSGCLEYLNVSQHSQMSGADVGLAGALSECPQQLPGCLLAAKKSDAISF